MALPAQVTTNLFSDFKNTSLGPFSQVSQIVQDTGSSGSNIGRVGGEKAGQSFLASGGDLIRADLFFLKTGSPTDNLIAKLCADSSGSPGAVLATSTAVPGATVGATSTRCRFIFQLPYETQAGTTYWITVERTGADDSSNYYDCMGTTSNAYADGQSKGFSNVAGWVTSGILDRRFAFTTKGTARYVPAVDKTNNKIRMYKSVNGGNTWAEQDAANAPGISTTSGFKTACAFSSNTLIIVFHATTLPGIGRPEFDTGTDTWSVPLAASTTFNNGVNGTLPLLANKFPDGGTYTFVTSFQGATETVMGSARRRIKLRRRDSGNFNADPGYDIVGSANTPNATLPGTAVDYDVRAAIMDGNGTWHSFWTQSDDANVRHRAFKLDSTFETANTLGSTPATTSNSANYPLGTGTTYYRNGEWYVALPVTTSGAIIVSRVKAVDASTQSAWTNTSVVASGAETTNSNPAVLLADNEQGGKLFLIYTKTDGKLYYTHDQAGDSWVAEQELHPGTKTVGGLSGGVLIDAVGIAYLDTAPTPDDLKFDSL